VQEGLTNILKHAGKNVDCRLQLAWEPQDLRIQIENDTRPAEAHRPQPHSAGRGLVGLGERVHAVGGQLRAGPHRAGYRLCAVLPVADTHTEYGPTPASSHRRLDRLVLAENEELT
jgi:glucose-6-phosphate-specific signal transduction histidine kinase